MFTGIIEEVGSIKNISTDKNKNIILQISAKQIVADVKLGDSIAVNGICLTVTDLKKTEIEFNVMPITAETSDFKQLRKGDPVNLERAATLETRLGGHLVSGHIDATAKIAAITNKQKQYELEINIPENFNKYLIAKGSVAVDGISLTVQAVQPKSFTVGIIPHTLANTSLKNKKPGDLVNLEFDQIAKYVENLLNNKSKRSTLSKYALF